VSVELRLQGIEEFREALRNLPAELAGEAGHLALAAANSAAVSIRAAYGQHRVTGNLQEHVIVEPPVTIGGTVAGARVRSTARHAYLFEYGTQARHYVTKKKGVVHRTGKMWGKTPPVHIFIPTAIRVRRRMTEDLIDLLRRHGLLVTGDGGT
jgi:hypothetical protein